MTESARLPPDEAREASWPARPWNNARASSGAASIDDHLVGLLSPSSFDAEPYRILVSALERIRGQRTSLTIAVTSAAPGDGKTTTAINLAALLARGPEGRVLLVDADLRRPAIGKALGIEGEDGPGLVRVLEGGQGLAEVLTPWPPLPLSVLPAGRTTRMAHEALASPEFTAFVQKARQTYRYVLLDTPPVVALPDARALADRVDGFLVVVRAGTTPRRLVAEALEALEPQKVLGLVWNGDEHPLSGYYARYRSYYASSTLRD